MKTSKKKNNRWEYVDAAQSVLDRRTMRLFSDFSNTLPIDELNLLNSSRNLYKKLANFALLWYNKIGQYYFEKYNGKQGFWSDDTITDYLEEAEPVSGYVFMNEAERKRDRLFESLTANRKTKDAEIRKARRLWMLQSDHYAEAVSDLGQMQAYKSRGAKYLRWITNIDGRECQECFLRNGKVYPINKFPSKPHYHCRCTFETATKEDYERQQKTPS